MFSDRVSYVSVEVRVSLPRLKIRIQPVTGFYLQHTQVTFGPVGWMKRNPKGPDLEYDVQLNYILWYYEKFSCNMRAFTAIYITPDACFMSEQATSI